MKYGIVSYNMYGNFTNYGSALQSYALQTAVNRIGNSTSIIIDYLPDILKNKDPLNPMKNIWDVDPISRHCCELCMPAIRENFKKFSTFYGEHYIKTKKVYTSANFDKSASKEQLDGYICGSDTIWCTLEFHGFDDGYFGNYDSMKRLRTISYAASFGDAIFSEADKKTLVERLKNFRMIGIREDTMIDFIRKNVSVPVKRVIDPTFLLTADDYQKITSPRLIPEKYILLYSRRYNKEMDEFTDKLAEQYGYRVVEISLRATNSYKHKMFYEAGVEDFLSLTKYAEIIVTNSYHGAIFAIQTQRPFYVFCREQANTKIPQMLHLLGLSDRLVSSPGQKNHEPNYCSVNEKLNELREESLSFLKNELME